MKREIIGKCELYFGDAYQIVPTIGKVDCCIIDPPYEFETSGGGRFRRQGRDCMDKIADAGIDKGFDHTFLKSSLADSVICFCHNDQLPKLLPWFDSNFSKFALCQWHKENPMPVANKHYKPDTEFYIHAWNKDGYPVGDLANKSRYVFSPVGKSEFDHPTVKPDSVMNKIMSNVNGDLILDCFMGSGSTGVACVNAGKRFIGIEHDESYFNIACKRIENAYRQGKLL